ncbi:MAG: hypothetical protein V4585_05220 [Bacteroidota bacterium]|jgi:hypothetical protein
MRQKKTWNFKRTLVITLFVILGISVFTAILGLYNLKPFLSKRIQSAVLATTDSLYYIDFKGIKYDIVTGNAHILEVTLRADTSLFSSLKKEKKMPDNVYQGKVNNIQLTGLKPWAIFFSKELDLNSILIQDPIVEIIHQKQPYNSFTTIKSPYQIISKFIKSFSVQKISLKNIDFTYNNLLRPEKHRVSKLKNLDLEVSDVLIDSLSHKDTLRFYYTKECIFSLNKLEFQAEDSLNTLKIKELLFSTKSRILTMKHLIYQPRYSEMEYSNRTQGDDRIGVVFNDVKLEQIDLHKLFEEKKIYAKLLRINHGKVNVFTDTRIFNIPPKPKYRPYPHEDFRGWDAKFMIDTIKLSNFDITYSEYNPETSLVGNVMFNKIHGNVTNFTNDTIPLQKNPHCIVFLRAKLMDKAAMFLKFNFDVMAPKGDFICTGKVSNMEMAAVNQVTKALVMAKTEKGFVSDFSFVMNADKYGINGSMTMLYQDLNVTILKKTSEKKAFKERKILSFIANTFLVKNGNPIRKKPVRIAIIKYTRVPTRPFFYTIWKGLVEGVKGSVL